MNMSVSGMEPAPNLEVIELNGRIIELLELNNALTSRCANMRGQMTLKDTENSRLVRELALCRSREVVREAEIAKEKEKENNPPMVKNGNGAASEAS